MMTNEMVSLLEMVRAARLELIDESGDSARRVVITGRSVARR